MGFGLRVLSDASLFCLVYKAELRKESPAKLEEPFGADVNISLGGPRAGDFFSVSFRRRL